MKVFRRLSWLTIAATWWGVGAAVFAADAAKADGWREAVAARWAAGPAQAVAQAIRDVPEHRQTLETVADWLLQDGVGGGLTVESLGRVLGELGPAAKELQQRFEEFQRSRLPLADSRWAALYLSACEQRRAARLGPYRELLKRIIFTKHYDLGGSHYAYTEGQSDAQAERHFTPGGSLCLLEMDGLHGRVRTLLDDPKGVIRDPDVSYDGRRVLLAWKKSLNEDDYHLCELLVADGTIRQLTFGLGFADYEGAYLPGGEIIFNSTRCVQTVDCWWTEVSNLFTCDGEGRYLRQLSFDQVHTNYPTVTDDGRVIYTRWDYNDRGQIYPQGLFQMNPDGTGQTEVYGNNSWFPTTILHARSIPGTGKIACIFTGHHSRQKGWLGMLDPSRGRQENQGAQLIAPVRDTPAVRIDAYGQSGDQFQYPYPLGETAFLAAFRTEKAPRFGIYFIMIDGRRELLASDPQISCNQPVPLRPRARPTLRPNMVDYRKNTGTVYLHDVYLGPGLAGVPRGAIRGLRVIALDFRAAGIGSNGNSGPAGGAMASTPISVQGAWDVKQVLGTAKVHQDGSACISVPARTPLYFQALDEKGQMVQSMRSWTSVQPGETASCVGCHEHKNTAPPVTRPTRAAAAGPQALEPFHGPPRGFSFIQEIQPILDRHCVRCHYLERPPGEASGGLPAAASTAAEVQPAFSLKGVQTLDSKSQRKWSDSYLALANRRFANWINIQSAPPMLPPYHAGASQSKLVAVLEEGKHYQVNLSRAELERLIVWIDLLVPYCGDYTEAMADDKIPRYNHFLDKRRCWQAEEAANIRQYLQTR